MFFFPAPARTGGDASLSSETRGGMGDCLRGYETTAGRRASVRAAEREIYFRARVGDASWEVRVGLVRVLRRATVERRSHRLLDVRGREYRRVAYAMGAALSWCRPLLLMMLPPTGRTLRLAWMIPSCC